VQESDCRKRIAQLHFQRIAFIKKPEHFMGSVPALRLWAAKIIRSPWNPGCSGKQETLLSGDLGMKPVFAKLDRRMKDMKWI